MLRINARLFFHLYNLLIKRYGMKSTFLVSSYESLAIFSWTLGVCESNRRTQNGFKHLGDTIHHKFYEVLICVIKMTTHYLKPKDLNFHNVHPRIRNNRSEFSHLKNCMGAPDGLTLGHQLLLIRR